MTPWIVAYQAPLSMGVSSKNTGVGCHFLLQEDLKNSLKRLLDLINEFRKVVGYKISIQKSVAFLYTNKELSEIESKKTISFNITSK